MQSALLYNAQGYAKFDIFEIYEDSHHAEHFIWRKIIIEFYR